MADTMWIRGENGALHVFDVPLPFGIQHRLDHGELVRVNADGSAWVEPDEEVLEPPLGDLLPDAPPLPKRTDSRAVWSEFAISQGMDRAAVAGMSKNQLIDALSS